ncbi:hypothetical protein ALC57_09474 [Trachymyrmex cornetzi]|uniref:Uncharacterized protein n=1 Tax=Trachymyrmex cornetzi TaxID=471704 RepID=A0A151J5H1_9HYME|nr:hypothetical protein ALC57_09474 [Trachymyrmex cornetzi]
MGLPWRGHACRAIHLTAIATITLPDLWQWDLVL